MPGATCNVICGHFWAKRIEVARLRRPNYVNNFNQIDITMTKKSDLHGVGLKKVDSRCVREMEGVFPQRASEA